MPDSTRHPRAARTSRRAPALVGALLVASVLGCTSDAPRGRDAVVVTMSVDGEVAGKLSERELRAELARLRFEREGRSLKAAPLPLEVRTAALDRLVERRVLLLEAQRLGVAASTTAVAQEFARARDAYGERELLTHLMGAYQTEDDYRAALTERLTVGRLVSQQSHANVAVTPTELEAAWAASPDTEKRQEPRIHASQIVVVTEEEGNQALEELKRKVPFAEVALRHSFAPEAARGGDLGWLSKDSMPSAFEPLFMLEVGQTSPLVSTEYGFHIFRVHAREDAKVRTLDEARPALEAKLLRAKLEASETTYVRGVLARYTITKDEQALARIE
jgi:peptidyl-prolyl cis-trans isomerase C